MRDVGRRLLPQLLGVTLKIDAHAALVSLGSFGAGPGFMFFDSPTATHIWAEIMSDADGGPRRR